MFGKSIVNVTILSPSISKVLAVLTRKVFSLKRHDGKWISCMRSCMISWQRDLAGKSLNIVNDWQNFRKHENAELMALLGLEHNNTSKKRIRYAAKPHTVNTIERFVHGADVALCRCGSSGVFRVSGHPPFCLGALF